MRCLGTANEGWFDQWALLSAFKRKAISLGVHYIHGNVVDIMADPKGQAAGVEVRNWQHIESALNVHFLNALTKAE